MRDGGGAAVEGAVRLLGGRVRVAARDDDAVCVEHVDQLERPVELRGERHLGHVPGGEQSLEQPGVGVAAGRDRMGAEAEGREERALQVGADDPRADRLARTSASAATSSASGAVIKVGWNAVTPHSRSASPAIRGVVGGREVDPAEAVDLQVDQARDRRAAATGPVHADRRDAAVRDLDVAAQQHAVDDRGLDAQSHASSRARRT